MKPSPYLKIYPHPRQPEQSILCSFPRGAVVAVPREAASAIRKGKVPPEAARQLAELGLMVEDQSHEKEQVLNYYQALHQASPGLRIAVILGMECNFNCCYCYEGDLKGRQRMSDETIQQLVEFIKSRFLKQHRKLVLDFYGGEPLLYVDRIIAIASRLQAFLKENDAEFEFTLVTNGSLLSWAIVDRLVPYGLTRARVTLDGPPGIHNVYRPFKNGAASFDIIIDNIREVCETIQVAIGGNFTRENYWRFPELLHVLLEKGLTPDKISQIKFTPVMQTGDWVTFSEFQGGCACPSDPWVAEATLSLREEILKHGFRTPKPGPATCMIENPDALAINYDGSIYKCAGLIGHTRFSIGDIRKGTDDYQQLYGLDSWRKEKQCRDCGYLPLCFGGCRFAKYHSDGKIDQVNCMKGFLDLALETMIQQDVMYPR